MPRSRFDRLTPERREEILDVAARHFAQGGYEGASYNRILEDAQLSKGSAYYTFDGKADLYAAVLRRETERMLTALPEPSPPTTAVGFWRGVRDWLEGGLHFFENEPQTASLLRGYTAGRQAGTVPQLEADLEGMAATSVTALLITGQQVGAVRDDVDLELLTGLAAAALASLDLHYLPRLDGVPQKRRAAILDVYLDTLTRLLKPARGRAVRRR